MSDDFDGFYNTWISVFDTHPKKSYIMACGLCLEGALKFFSDKEQKCQIYHSLHILNKEDDNNFELLFNKFMTHIDNNESIQRFGKYFKQ